MSGLDAPFSKQCLLEASNFYLTFYKTRQLATWLQVSLECQVQSGFQAYSSKRKRFTLSIKTLSFRRIGLKPSLDLAIQGDL